MAAAHAALARGGWRLGGSGRARRCLGRVADYRAVAEELQPGHSLAGFTVTRVTQVDEWVTLLAAAAARERAHDERGDGVTWRIGRKAMLMGIPSSAGLPHMILL